MGEITGDYEYSKEHVFSHIRKVEWKKIYGLNLLKSDFLPEILEKKLQRITTFIELTESDWKEIEECNIEGKNHPITTEKDIQLYISTNLEKLRNGLKLFSHEHSLPDEKYEIWRRIDVLAYEDKGEHVDLYVIEVKRGTAGRSALAQTLNYIKLVEKNFVDYENVFGIIVAYDFTNELKEEAAKMSKISLKKYRHDFSFTE